MGKIKNISLGWGFMAPAIIFVLLFTIIPLMYAFHLSAYNTNGLIPGVFVGFGNYVTLFTKDPLFYKTFIILVIYLAIGVSLQTVGPLLGAKMIYSLKSDRLGYLYRVIFVLPLIVPSVVTILVWKNMYLSSGAINKFLTAIGFGDITMSWIGNPDTALYAILFMAVPFIGGINLLIFLAGFMNLDKSMYEAGRMEGAGWWHMFRKIEVPLLMPQLRITFVLSIVGLATNYQQIIIMTQGGPGNSTMLPAYYMFQNAFKFGKLGYGTAIGVILFILLLGFTFISFKFMKNRDA